MKRRRFFSNMLTGTLGMGLGVSTAKAAVGKAESQISSGIARTVSATGHQISYHVQGIKQPIKVLHVTDTHLFLDDARGEAYSQYSGRMAKAYNQTTHWLLPRNRMWICWVCPGIYSAFLPKQP